MRGKRRWNRSFQIGTLCETLKGFPYIEIESTTKFVDGLSCLRKKKYPTKGHHNKSYLSISLVCVCVCVCKFALFFSPFFAAPRQTVDAYLSNTAKRLTSKRTLWCPLPPLHYNRWCLLSFTWPLNSFPFFRPRGLHFFVVFSGDLKQQPSRFKRKQRQAQINCNV